MHVLDEAVQIHPNAWWWVKADGCDLISGLAESTKGVWHGDVDLNDGDLKKQYDVYQNRLLEVGSIKMRSDRVALCAQLTSHANAIKKDMEFLRTGIYVSYMYSGTPQCGLPEMQKPLYSGHFFCII